MKGPSRSSWKPCREFLGEFGLQLRGGDKPAARDFARLLSEIQARPDAHLIQTVMLRSLQQAVYSPDNVGHFGLAFDAYAHFTSPIRRYPDLLVHRAIRHLLEHKRAKGFRYDHGAMAKLGENCSQTERRADEATRDATDWLKCEFMLDKVGEEYDGTISSVTSFGLFIELDDIYVEGLVHVTSLEKDYFHFEPVKHRMLGERTRKVYRLGDRLRIRVARVDLDERKIDFDLAGEVTTMAEDNTAKPGRKRRRRKSAKKKTEQKKTVEKKAVTKKKVAKKKAAKKKTTAAKPEKKASRKKITKKKAAKKKGS